MATICVPRCLHPCQQTRAFMTHDTLWQCGGRHCYDGSVFHRARLFLAMIVLVHLITPASVRACACGCGVFQVGTSSMFPAHEGSTAFLEYNFQSQNRNWAGSSPSNADNNTDKKIVTNFLTLGYQHMFN